MNSDANVQRIPKRILNTLLSALAAGVVPRVGAPYVAIGRKDEIAALLSDLEQIDEGGSTMRFIIGRYGSGKSFLIQLIRGYALERDFLTADADLSPERRLYGTGGSGVATYRELIKNLASKSSPDGNALPKIIARWVDVLRAEVLSKGVSPDDANFANMLNIAVSEKLSEIEFMVGGFDFSRVITEYYRAICEDNDDKKRACLCWLRGEFSTKTEARSALGFNVSVIIDDDNWYDFIKLISSLSVKLGYSGLILFIDECVNLYKIPNRIPREANYEKILTIFNDTLQGKAKSLGIIFGGTPQFLEDTRRGLFSYEALKSRLEDSRYGALGYQNLSSPVIRLRTLSDNELLALVRRLTKLYAEKEGMEAPPITDEEIVAFLTNALSKTGVEEMITPREIIRDYLTLLNILKDNKDVKLSDLLGKISYDLSRDSEGDVIVKNSKLPGNNKINLFDIDI